MIDLTGRVALVTGASRGIGKACALRLAEAGADTILNYVTSQTAANEVAQEIQAMGRQAATVKADVSEQEDVAAMMEYVEATFGKLDILVSNAATGGFRPLLATTARHFEAAMKTNVLALVYLLQSGVRLLERAEGLRQSDRLIEPRLASCPAHVRPHRRIEGGVGESGEAFCAGVGRSRHQRQRGPGRVGGDRFHSPVAQRRGDLRSKQGEGTHGRAPVDA